jgi:two-component system chemotaxis response regulator CheY
MQLTDQVKDLHFLVVDDFESMRLIAVTSLKKLGVKKISTASSGNDAFEIIKSSYKTNPIHFVLSDLVMENGTGLDLVKLIRANPATSTLPIVMISSMSEVSHIMDCVMAGANDYLTKPWKVEDLVKKISDIASGKKK